jgi:hypothetical protein
MCCVVRDCRVQVDVKDKYCGLHLNAEILLKAAQDALKLIADTSRKMSADELVRVEKIREIVEQCDFMSSVKHDEG